MERMNCNHLVGPGKWAHELCDESSRSGQAFLSNLKGFHSAAPGTAQANSTSLAATLGNKDEPTPQPQWKTFSTGTSAISNQTSNIPSTKKCFSSRTRFLAPRTIKNICHAALANVSEGGSEVAISRPTQDRKTSQRTEKCPLQFL